MAIIVLFSLIFILFAIQFFLYNKQRKEQHSLSGLPVSLPLPKVDFSFTNPKNYLLCVSIHCSQCKKIIHELMTSDMDRNDIYLLFTDEANEVEGYLQKISHPNRSIQYSSGHKPEELYLSVTPFAYLTDAKGIVLNKKFFQSLKDINIHIKEV